jgi:uncharacterized lipoprotein YddW (UPF0748 family)
MQGRWGGPKALALWTVVLALGLGACSSSDGDGSDDAWDPETGASESTVGDTGADDEADDDAVDDGDSTAPADDSTGEDPRELVQVGHTREFRAVWVASVNNINFPSARGLDVATLQAELRSAVDTAVATNLNVIVFQVRPECDALYASELEPWSRYLTGTQGGDPGFDPLTYLVDEAHVRGIEIHAWFNPYRAKATLSDAVVLPHLSLQYPEFAYPYGNFMWMDPAAIEVRESSVDAIVDVIERYDVDGVHFDDYFYPYPDGNEFPDDATRQAYLDGGGTLSLGDWRRQNVHDMVEAVHVAIEATRPDVRFGISPFGIYRPGQPEGITGLDQYEAIYSDPLVWIDEGWVDYLAPQLYWPTTQTQQAYAPLVAWWAEQTSGGRYIFPGNFLSKLGSDANWDVDEFLAQLDLTRAQSEWGVQGNIWFHIAPLASDQDGVATAFVDEYYDAPVLTPPLAAHLDDFVEAPYVELAGDMAALEAGDDQRLRAWAIYEDLGAGWELAELVPATTTSVPLGSGRWAVSAVARTGAESLGTVVDVP